MYKRQKLQEVVLAILTQMDALITELSEVAKPDLAAKRALAASAFALFDVTLAATTLTKPSISLCAKLYGLAVKSEGAAPGQLKAAAATVARRAALHGGAHKELHTKMQALLPANKR